MCEAMFSLLEELDKKAADGNQVATSWMSSMVWPRLAWPRELLLHLRGVQFKGIPSETVFKPLLEWATGWGTTKSAEDAINIAKNCKLLSGSKKHQIKEIFNHWLGSTLLQDADRPRLPGRRAPDEVRLAIKERLTELTRPNFQQTSLDQNEMFRFGSNSFASLSAEAWRLQGMATAAAMQVSVDDLGSVWMSMMWKIGMIVQRADLGYYYMVAGANHFGALIWRLFEVVVQRHAGAAFRCLVFGDPDEDEEDRVEAVRNVLEFVTVVDDKWRCGDASVVPPSELDPADFDDFSPLSKGPVLVPTNLSPMLEYSAKRGFKGLSTALLTKLAKSHLKLIFERGSTPSGLEGWLRACLRAVLPTFSDEDINEIISLRTSGNDDEENDDEQDLMEGFLEKTHRDMLKGVVGEDDVDEVKN